MSRELPEFRVKLIAHMCSNVSYLRIRGTKGHRAVEYFSASETPLALSNMCDNAAEARFALEDAADLSQLLSAVKKHATHAKTFSII